MTKVVFETAALADSIKKAERVAPSKGAAFDKSAGIVLDLQPQDSSVVVRATNTLIYYMEWVDPLEIEGDAKSWRIPSRVFAGVIGSLPIGSGKKVTIEEVQNGVQTQLLLTSGRTKARFNLLPIEYYPAWTPFDPDNLFPAPDLGGRLAQVEWAAGKEGDIPWCGVHFDGEIAVATDRYRIATVPLKIEGLDRGVTVPAGMLTPVLKQTGEVMIGVEENFLLVMPDEHTQVRASIYAAQYPNTKHIVNREPTQKTMLRKGELLEIINRANNFSGADRTPMLRMFFGKEEIAVMMANGEIGLLGDVVETPGFGDHERIEIRFTPKNIADALDKAPNEEVILGYTPEKPDAAFYIDGGSGYKALVQPRKAGEQQS